MDMELSSAASGDAAAVASQRPAGEPCDASEGAGAAVQSSAVLGDGERVPAKGTGW